MRKYLKHKNILETFNLNSEDFKKHLENPLIGENLGSFLFENCEEENLWIFRDVLEGISYAHENNVFHGDLKPDNVFIFYDDETDKSYASISDFDIESQMDTITYIAPELLDVKLIDHRVDIYSLGKILYEILSLEKPFPEMNLSSAPSEFHFIIQKCTEKNPDNRFQTVREIIEIFDALTHESKKTLQD